MATNKPLGQSLDIDKRFAYEDGIAYRGHRQDMKPVLRHAERTRTKVNEAPKSGNKNGWEHMGTIPMSLLLDWLSKHGYQIDQWARNDGGEPYGADWRKDGGVKSQFLRFFMSRDFSKLHSNHATTRKERGHVTVPAGYKSNSGILVPEGG